MGIPPPPTLDEFAEANKRQYPSWMDDTLPQDVLDQIAASEASTGTIVKWLHALGYEEATENKVQKWRLRHGRRTR